MRTKDYIKKLSKVQLISVVESSGYLKDNQDELDEFLSEIKSLPVKVVRDKFLAIEVLYNYIEDVLLPEYLDEYYSNITNEEIVALCERYNIRNYTINDDKTIDVNGNVEFTRWQLTWLEFTSIPIRFNKVNGNFVYGSDNLKSFIGLPKEVTGDFNIEGEFDSLENFPYVNNSRSVYIKSHRIKSLKGLKGKFDGLSIYSNSLDSLEGLTTNIKWLRLNCRKFTLLNQLPTYIGLFISEYTPIYHFIKEFENDLEFLLYDTIIEPSENQNEKPNLYYKLYATKLNYIGKRSPTKENLKKLKKYYNIVY